MDDSSEDLNNRDRRSLVERAAARISVQSKDGAEAARPPAAPRASAVESASEVATALDSGVAPCTPEPQTEDASILADEPEPLKEPLTEAAGEAVNSAPAGRTPAGRTPAAPPVRGKRHVSIDVGHLMERNILTPATKRNRTLEEFRLIKRMVLSRRWDQSDRPGNTVIVTSALPSEGKTTTAINLAMSIAAEEDVRVLLVDADFIRADALRQLGVSAKQGLIDVIENPNLDLSEVMLTTDIDKLTLLPSGQLHERCTELLASARMDDVVAELANRYDDRIIIFDSPPILATTESVALSSHMGQIVFVVQAGRTSRESIHSALELIDDPQRIGLVLNRTRNQFGRTGFGAYYDSHYYGYGSGG